MLPAYLESPTRVYEWPKSITQEEQSLIPWRPDPEPWPELTRWSLPNQGSLPKSLGIYPTWNSVQPPYFWTTTLTTATHTSWGEPHLRKPFCQRRSMSACNPPTGTESAPTGSTTEGLQIPNSRRQSKPSDKRLATVGWYLTTKTQLLSAVSRNWP